MENADGYKVRDDVIGVRFPRDAVRSCPHPAVIKRYGTGGVANVSAWTCSKCRFGVRTKYCGLWGCEYELGLSSTKAD